MREHVRLLVSGPDALHQALTDRAGMLPLLAIQDSIATYRSEVKCWLLFLQTTGQSISEVLNSRQSLVLHYITIFKNCKTAQKYVQALRWLHDRFECGINWDDRVLQAHLRGVENISKNLGVFRTKPELTLKQIEQIILTADRWGEEEFATQCSVTSEYLLRVPSECLRLCRDDISRHSKIDFLGMSTSNVPTGMRLSLKKRKNCPQGWASVRRCRCGVQFALESPHPLCSTHRIWNWVRRHHGSVGPIFRMGARAFTTVLRKIATVLGIPFAEILSSHVFRRSIALHMLRSKCSLATILQAGSWKSGAFMAYCQRHVIEEEAALACLVDDSDTDTEEHAVVAPSTAGKSSRGPKSGSMGQATTMHDYLTRR